LQSSQRMQCLYLTQLGDTRKRGSGKHSAPLLRGVYNLGL